MKLAKVRSVLFIAVGTFMIAMGQLNGIASAATTNSSSTSNTANNNANSLKISPLRTDLTIAPGTTGIAKVYVTNLTSKPIELQAIENDFVAGDESGTPALILNPASYAPSHSLKRFMVPIPNITLGAGATQEVDVHIAVPKTAQAGGYFGALRFAPAGSGSNLVNLNGSVASLILMTVPGPTFEQLLLTNFAVQQDGGSATSFRNPNNLSLFVRFENKGNLQESPFGQMYVQKGKKVLYTYDFNQADPQQEILPDSFRRWSVPIKGMGKFGKYTVGATFTYGTKGETIDITKTIWIIPTTYIFGGIITLVVLVVLIGGAWIFLKSYKRRILKSSRRRY